ncbi:CPBP family intramembrane metalloprotease [Flavobacteriaceae bacterium TP-CH-4]|uniref:CPBP family intramembrane metalloprotease n=1 Tax=Pelagihabitans pacificus TaxID=2696054 RepID=A0A967AU79_9FLAO|nr:type II CAAX endopeptidase family protein [Pelagihabitans pacificus]NHF60471.1 CPBP family intramembrane metalloprotease [Pelagihabitans pacificus]
MKPLGTLLKDNRWVKIAELAILFALAVLFIKVFLREGDEYLIYNQIVLWVANLLMLAYVWAGIRLRGERLADFGLHFKKPSRRQVLRTFLWSLLVFVLAMIGFVVGSIIMANITGIPQNTNLGGYDYLKDNFGMLILTLFGVYLVSSFGEELVYRAFLINRLQQLGLNGKWGTYLAIVIAAIIFGLAHFGWGPMGIVQTACMGLVLGVCYIFLKKRLWILVLAHMYMDTILMAQLYMASNTPP